MFLRFAACLFEGVRAVKLRFAEYGSPTVVRDGETGKDTPTEGVLWVEEQTGRVLKTYMKLKVGETSMEVSVAYKPVKTEGVWLPSLMQERYSGSEDRMECVARYSNVRRFQVNTQEVVR